MKALLKRTEFVNAKDAGDTLPRRLLFRNCGGPTVVGIRTGILVVRIRSINKGTSLATVSSNPAVSPLFSLPDYHLSDTWSRALIKQTFKFRKNEENEIHYRWLKFNVFTRWLHSTKQTIILVLDPLPHIMELLPRPLLDDFDAEILGDPYWIYALLVEEIVRLQDKAVWAIRDLVRETEKNRTSPKKPKPEKPRPNYPLLHDIARHAIHVSETLGLAVNTIESILREHEQFISHISDADRKMKAVSKQIHRRLLFYDQMLLSLRSRSTSNKERLLNEIGLAFNTVAQYDSHIFVEIGRAAQSDSAAMKGVAFVTLTFLPATFISAIFSMSFFNYGADSGSWSVSDKFWIYWAVAAPITILTSILWYCWNRLFPPMPIGEEREQARGEKRVEEEMREVAKKLRWNVEDGDVAGKV